MYVFKQMPIIQTNGRRKMSRHDFLTVVTNPAVYVNILIRHIFYAFLFVPCSVPIKIYCSMFIIFTLQFLITILTILIYIAFDQKPNSYMFLSTFFLVDIKSALNWLQLKIFYAWLLCINRH